MKTDEITVDVRDLRLDTLRTIKSNLEQYAHLAAYHQTFLIVCAELKRRDRISRGEAA